MCFRVLHILFLTIYVHLLVSHCHIYNVISVRTFLVFEDGVTVLIYTNVKVSELTHLILILLFLHSSLQGCLFHLPFCLALH